MRRRDFMALVGGTAGTWPFAANAQGATKRPFIGVMVAVTLPDNPPPAGNRGFDTVAELPRNEPDTTFPSNTGNTYAVTANSFSDLQSKVNMAAKVAGSAHHYINVPPGTYSGTLNLPARTGSGWIVIQSNGS